MKAIIALLLLSLCVAFVAATDSDAAILKAFADFQTRFQKNYASQAERFHRLSVFVENIERVRKMNLEHGDPVFGVTKFMDLTPAEFKAQYLTLTVPADPPVFEKASIDKHAQVPASFDWRQANISGVISAVKNQEQCGSCWAFSTAESVESAWVLAGNSPQVLSPQQIVDCDTTDDGCNGGLPSNAYQYVIKAGGLETEAAYPYTAVDGTCNFQKNKVVSSITKWVSVSTTAAQEDTDMLNYVANTGPVSVCVDAAPWQYYTGGVLKTCGRTIDHAVQATGYGTQQGLPVWNVRNSWGADWGENGYIWLKRGVNLCQIATIVTAAVA